MQSKENSLLESSLNVFQDFIVAFLIWMVAIDVSLSESDSGIIIVMLVALAFLRAYLWRRLFVLLDAR